MIDYFLVRVTQSVFQSDASATSRPMSLYVEHPNDIERQFSNIAYDKGKKKCINEIFVLIIYKCSWKRFANVYECAVGSYIRERIELIS